MQLDPPRGDSSSTASQLIRDRKADAILIIDIDHPFAPSFFEPSTRQLVFDLLCKANYDEAPIFNLKSKCQRY